MSTLPSIFVSHGAPTLPFEAVPARDFLRQLGRALPRPQAIIVVSAHDMGEAVVLGTAERLHAVHDFHGFPRELYALAYDAPGAPDLASDVAQRLALAGFPPQTRADGGIDHGVWVPLMLIYPEADIPVLSLSLRHTLNEAEHWRIGRALAPLREQGVLVLGSGSLTHNLGDVVWGEGGAQPLPYVAEFAGWMQARLEAGDKAAVLDWRGQAPAAHRAHPTSEHLMPLFVVLGAGGGGPAQTLHQSYTYGALAMHSFAVGAAIGNGN